MCYVNKRAHMPVIHCINHSGWRPISLRLGRRTEFNALVEAAVEDGYINCTVKDKSIRQKSNLGELEVAKPKSIFTGDLFHVSIACSSTMHFSALMRVLL